MNKLKVAVLLDVQNIYYTARHTFGKNVNYNLLWADISQRFDIVIANAYVIASQDPKQRQFHHILRGIGFNVQLKPYIQRSDGSAKGDWDVGITLDAVELAEKVEHIVLLSGDGDFAMLLERLEQKYAVKSSVYSVKALTANALIESAQDHTEISSPWLI